MPGEHAANFIRKSIRDKAWDDPVIDLGAGNDATYYRPIFKTAKYVTLDIQQNKSKDIDIIADMTAMPEVATETYGVVLLLETLEHVLNPFKAFKEITRILKPGGLLICTTVTCFRVHNHPRDYWRFLPDGLAALCEQTGLTPILIEMTSDNVTAPCFIMVSAQK